MTLTSDLLELPEVDIARHSDAALALRQQLRRRI